MLKVALTEDDNIRLHDEAEALRKIHSEFIVAIEDELPMSGRTVLVLQKAGDRTLASVLAKDRGAEPRPALSLRRGFALGVVLDGTPWRCAIGTSSPTTSAFVRSPRGGNQLVLFDFSLARAPLDNINVGTEGYRDPFLKLRKPPRWDLAAERYSAAVTLYEMTLGPGVLPQWGEDKSDPALTNDELVLDADKFDSNIRDGLR